ncbi:MAG: hypothetical protein ACOCWQ_05650 [Nanoarchaeota archaeon]
MELHDIVRFSAPAFFGGFMMGISGLGQNLIDRATITEATLPATQREKKGMDDEKLGTLRKRGRQLKQYLPAVLGGAACVFPAISAEESAAQTALFAIPSAYVGRYMGSLIRRLGMKKIWQEVEIARNIRDDPENALFYLPDDLRQGLSAHLDTAYQNVLDGNSPKQAVEEIFQTLEDTPTFYSGRLGQWMGEQLPTIYDKANTERSLSDFFEHPDFAAVVGETQHLSLRVYERQGESMVSYQGEFERLRMVEDEDSLSVTNAILRLDEQDRSAIDYRTLAERIVEANKDHTVILLQADRKMCARARELLVMNAFFQAYASK